MLAIVCGFTRYVHINRLKNDTVLAALLGVDVQPGKRHSGTCGMPRLWEIVDGLPAERKPRLLRGDIGYGGDENMGEAERRGRPKKNAFTLVQTEFDFVEDKVGRYWDCCALVTNDEKLDVASLAQIYRDRGIWELIILVAFRKWLDGKHSKGLLPKPLALIG